MIFEHFAINVPDPLAIANWYVNNVGLTIVRQQTQAPFITFLADKTGRVIMELYYRPEQTIMNFRGQHSLTFHFAMETSNAETEKNRLLQMGATFFEEQQLNDGSHLVILRDPWGICLQICQRGSRMNSVPLN